MWWQLLHQDPELCLSVVSIVAPKLQDTRLFYLRVAWPPQKPLECHFKTFYLAEVLYVPMVSLTFLKEMCREETVVRTTRCSTRVAYHVVMADT